MKGEKVENQGLLSKIGSSSSPRWKLKFLPKFFSASKHIPSALLLLGTKILKIIRLHRIPPPSKMLRPNIWVEKIEKLPCRVQGWLRLSAARTRSDWSKTFPARFFENGRVEEEEGRGGGEGHCYRIVANLGHDRICCWCLLRASDTFSQNSTQAKTASRLRSHKEYSLCRF